MTSRIDPNWKQRRVDAVDAYLGLIHVAIPSVTTGYNAAAKWYVYYLDSKNIRCKVINLGAGVKKIIVNDNVCPHCKGKGVI